MRSLICIVCLIGQCIEDRAVLGSFSGRSFKLHKNCQSGVYIKNILLFDTIFRHVALLVTDISRQDQNFRIIPRLPGRKYSVSTKSKICFASIPGAIGETGAKCYTGLNDTARFFQRMMPYMTFLTQSECAY